MNKKTILIFLIITTLFITLSKQDPKYEPKVNSVKQFCVNENDSSYFNRCFRQIPTNLLTLFSDTILQWINPRLLAVFIVYLILLLPLFQFHSKPFLTKTKTNSNNSPLSNEDILSSIKSLKISMKQFLKAKLFLINFLHRVGYSLMLDVALYTIFRQKRPCKCTLDGGKTFQHFGSIYGMPSGDSMAAALLGAVIFDLMPFSSFLGKVIGFAILPLIATERMAFGYHTLAQTTVGGCLGYILHYYSTRTPQFMIFFDTIFQFIFGLIVLNIDDALYYQPGTRNNLLSWFFWGVGFQLFVVCLTIRFFLNKKFFSKLWLSHVLLIENDLLFDDKNDKIIEDEAKLFIENKIGFKLNEKGIEDLKIQHNKYSINGNNDNNNNSNYYQNLENGEDENDELNQDINNTNNNIDDQDNGDDDSLAELEKNSKVSFIKSLVIKYKSLTEMFQNPELISIKIKKTIISNAESVVRKVINQDKFEINFQNDTMNLSDSFFVFLSGGLLIVGVVVSQAIAQYNVFGRQH